MVSTPKVPFGAEPVKAPDSLASVLTSSAASLAAAAVARSAARVSVPPPVVDTSMSAKLAPPLVDWAERLDVDDVLAKSVGAPAATVDDIGSAPCSIRDANLAPHGEPLLKVVATVVTSPGL